MYAAVTGLVEDTAFSITCRELAEGDLGVRLPIALDVPASAVAEGLHECVAGNNSGQLRLSPGRCYAPPAAALFPPPCLCATSATAPSTCIAALNARYPYCALLEPLSVT
jgi:hypothetical protein